ncbi:hypothetical protein [Cellulomonas sp. HZM]|uniref:hypothetical protein n=1 Tax=Cellulomonas sp. HZM TaxID=1454010 RepID=UPI0004933FA6|nr:hypothetical protein [Cellulomonas sp. HZM]
MGADDEARLRELAALTHRSLNDAAVLAIRETADRYGVAARFEAALADVERDDADIIDALSR